MAHIIKNYVEVSRVESSPEATLKKALKIRVSFLLAVSIRLDRNNPLRSLPHNPGKKSLKQPKQQRPQNKLPLKKQV
jgi:hypothetical protein